MKQRQYRLLRIKFEKNMWLIEYNVITVVKFNKDMHPNHVFRLITILFMRNKSGDLFFESSGPAHQKRVFVKCI